MAEQIVNNPTDQKVKWIHADPVTGSRAEVPKSGASDQYPRIELEPLGQEIQPVEPPQEPYTSSEARYSASSPEWLCQYDQSKDYWEMPTSCQAAFLTRNDVQLGHLLSSNNENNPEKIVMTDSPIPNYSLPDSPSDKVLAFASKTTAKKSGVRDDDGSEADIGEYKVDVFDDTIPDFVDASVSMSDNKSLVDLAVSDVKNIFDKDNECSRFFEQSVKLLTIFSTENGISNVTDLYLPKYDASVIANTLGNQLRENIGFLSADKAKNTTIGIEMYSRKNEGTIHQNQNGTLRYEEYQSAKVNIIGPFLNTGKFGNYSGRAGRTLAILHEIAHMIITGNQYDKKGNIIGSARLIIEDGGEENKEKSIANTAIIESKCKTELDSLK